MDRVEIEKSIEEKENLIWELRKEILSLKRALLPIKTGLNEGDVVVNRKGEKGILCYNGNETLWWGGKKIQERRYSFKCDTTCL